MLDLTNYGEYICLFFASYRKVFMRWQRKPQIQNDRSWMISADNDKGGNDGKVRPKEEVVELDVAVVRGGDRPLDPLHKLLVRLDVHFGIL